MSDVDALERFILGHPINGEESKAVARNVALLIRRLREVEADARMWEHQVEVVKSCGRCA